MPVWEIKKPLGITPSSIKPRKKKVVSVSPVTGIRAVDRLLFRQKWEDGREETRQSHKIPASNVSIREIRLLVDQVNANLASCGILIHLVLMVHDTAWSLDIYDCSGSHECRIINAMVIDLDELNGLLVSLQSAAGIMLDRVL